jgi:serine/threonine-protein kinase
MVNSKTPRWVFCSILLAGVLDCLHDLPLLPDRIASHFGPAGNANGWMTKSQFLLTYALVLLPALAVEFWLPRRIARTGGDRLRLPNKEYWLAPERRSETFAYFEKFFAWYGCAFLALEVFAMALAMRANLVTPPHLATDPIVSAVIAFVLFNLAAVIAMLRRFSNVE